jgi:hypothetical protein
VLVGVGFEERFLRLILILRVGGCLRNRSQPDG